MGDKKKELESIFELPRAFAGGMLPSFQISSAQTTCLVAASCLREAERAGF